GRCCPRVQHGEDLGDDDVEAQWHGFSTHCLRFTRSVTAPAQDSFPAGCSPLPSGSRTPWIAIEGFRATSSFSSSRLVLALAGPTYCASTYRSPSAPAPPARLAGSSSTTPGCCSTT